MLYLLNFLFIYLYYLLLYQNMRKTVTVGLVSYFKQPKMTSLQDYLLIIRKIIKASCFK